MNRTLKKRLQKLESDRNGISNTIRCVRTEDLDRTAKANMRPADLEILEEAMRLQSEEFSAKQEAVWNRWKIARANAVNEAADGAPFVIALDAIQSRL